MSFNGDAGKKEREITAKNVLKGVHRVRHDSFDTKKILTYAGVEPAIS